MATRSNVRVLILSAAVICTSLAIAWSAFADRGWAAENACVLFRGKPAVRTVEHERNGKVERTDFYSDGGYGVTRCDAAGDVTFGQEVSRVAVPGGRRSLLPTTTVESIGNGVLRHRFIEYGDPDDPYWARQWATEGTAAQNAVVPPTQAITVASGDSVNATTAGTGCGDNSFSLLGPNGWGGHYIHFIYYASIPRSTDAQKSEARQRIFDGHTAWNSTVNPCGYDSQGNILGVWAGDAGRPASPTPDGLSVSDFGGQRSFGCPGALACAYTFRNANGTISESDIRFGYLVPWYYGSGAVPSTEYDLWSAASHEVGHRIGLGHVGNCDLTMGSPCGITGDSRERNLGSGDVLGMRYLYPTAITRR